MDLSQHQARQLLQLHGVTVAPWQGSTSVDVALEMSLTLTIDFDERQFVVLWSAQGESGKRKKAEANLQPKKRFSVDSLRGIGQAEANQMVAEIGVPPALRGRTAHFLTIVWRAFQALDAILIEIDPLVVTPSGEIQVRGVRMRLDKRAAFRHPECDELMAASPERKAK
ncbi:MAG: hypothetical protein FWG16_01945, partial [Micrococcales bacterium]|nr:hypothetical protein [Micrococcales bacterium]